MDIEITAENPGNGAKVNIMDKLHILLFNCLYCSNSSVQRVTASKIAVASLKSFLFPIAKLFTNRYGSNTWLDGYSERNSCISRALIY